MIDFLNSKTVALFHSEYNDYLDVSPYHPHKNYPEYMFGVDAISINPNPAYESVRNVLFMLGLDKENFGKKEWNPFGEIIKPNDRVVLKPNFVLDRHEDGGELYSVITHPSVLRAVCDYVFLALKGSGEIIIADAPQADCDFEQLLKKTMLHDIQEVYRKEKKFKIQIYDLRQLRVGDFYDSSTRIIQEGDPKGYTIVDIGSKSLLVDLENLDKIYGSDYDRKEITAHHNMTKNEYCISNTILTADVIISIPKMKTHRKAGVTLCLKNLVGINGNKNYLPHFRIGLPEDGGDEFPTLNYEQKKVLYTNRFLKDVLLARKSKSLDRLYQFARSIYHVVIKIQPQANARDVIEGGCWQGNDTIWRMILDLNRILIYTDTDGKLCDKPQRKFFMLVDGIWAGEEEGPLKPKLKKTGIVVGGMNPLVTDIVLTEYMGIESNSIPKLKYGKKLSTYKLSNVDFTDIKVINCIKEQGKIMESNIKNDKFNMPRGWREDL